MIQVLERAFSVLDYLSADPDRLAGLSEIAQACGIQKTTLANILNTLESAGYVVRPQKRKGYRLGYKYYMQAGPAYVYEKWKELSAEEVKRIYDIFEETVVLATEYGGQRRVLNLMECHEGITARIPHSADIYQSATGRIILAYYPEHKIREIVSRVGLPSHESWEGIDSVDALLEGLAEIREKGISTTIFREHMLGVGVPVLVGGWPIASIGVCLPRFRCSESRLGIIHEVLDECAASIAEKVRSAYYSG